MNELLKFKLELQSMLGGALKKEGATAHGVFTGIDRDIQRTQRNLDELGKPIRVQVDTSQLRRAEGDINRVQQRMSALQSAGAVFLGTMAAQGLSRGLGFAQQQVADVLSGGKAAGAYKSDFATIGGKEGSGLFNQLRQYVKDSPFGTEQYGLAQEMLSYGVAVKEILPDLKMFGDITGLNAEKMKLLEYAFSQMTSMGYLRGEDKNQMTGAGFNPLLELQRTTGKSMATLMQMMESRQISAEMVRGAFVSATSPGGRYYGRLAGLTNTAAGQEAAQLGSIEDAKMTLGESLMPTYAQLLKETRPLVDELPKMFEELRPSIEVVVKGMADMVKWTRTHSETLDKWVGLVKVGVEAWAAWKIGTVAMTAANWAWVTSVGAQTTETVAQTAAIGEENAMIVAQTAAVNDLAAAWTMETRAAIRAGVAGTEAASMAGLGNTTMGFAAARASAGGAGLAAGFGSAVSSAVMPVAIAYFAGEALMQMAGKNMFTGKDFTWFGKNSFLNPNNSVAFGAGLTGFLGITPTMQEEMDKRRKIKELGGMMGGATMAQLQAGGAKAFDFGGLSYDLSGGKGNSSAVPTLSTDSATISGGGQKVINIYNNYHAPLYNVENQTFQRFQEAVEDMEPAVIQVMQKVLNSAPGGAPQY